MKKIKTLFGECIKGINDILVDEQNVQEIISDIETPSFGYERKLIIARNTGLFKKEAKKKSEQAKAEAEEAKKEAEANPEDEETIRCRHQARIQALQPLGYMLKEPAMQASIIFESCVYSL